MVKSLRRLLLHQLDKARCQTSPWTISKLNDIISSVALIVAAQVIKLCAGREYDLGTGMCAWSTLMFDREFKHFTDFNTCKWEVSINLIKRALTKLQENVL